MNTKNQFERYNPKLLAEAILKSVFSGLSVGFAVGFIAAAVVWLSPVDGLWIAPVAFVLASAVSAVIFYLAKYRITVIGSARRLDSLGLEERLITMIELEGNESYIARLQREDAKSALAGLDKSKFRFAFAKNVFVTLAVCGVLCMSMNTVSVLGELGYLPQGDEIIADILPEEREIYVSVSYLVEDGGEIEGDADQLILLGGNADSVTAIAHDGWAFVGWDDGSKRPTRQEKNLKEDFVVMAIFEQIEEEGDGDQEGDQAGDQEGDQPGDQEGQQQDGENGPSDEQESENTSDSGGGKYESYNQIIDGNTFYRDHLEYYKDLIKEYLEENGDSLTEEQKKIIEAYIGIV